MGTTARDAAECAQKHGFQADAIRDAKWNDLAKWWSEGLYPILFVNLFPLDALWVYHAVVLEEIFTNSVTYVDPAQGMREVTVDAFEQAWQMNKRQGIVISLY